MTGTNLVLNLFGDAVFYAFHLGGHNFQGKKMKEVLGTGKRWLVTAEPLRAVEESSWQL